MWITGASIKKITDENIVLKIKLKSKLFHFHAVFDKNLIKQESIQVGCIPPAFVVPGVYPSPRIPYPWISYPPGYPTLRYPTPWIPYLFPRYPTPRRNWILYLLKEHGTRDTLPSVDRMTLACENITFPKLRWLAVVIIFSSKLRDCRSPVWKILDPPLVCVCDLHSDILWSCETRQK